MPPIVSEDIPQAPGSANASVDYGQGTQVSADQRALQSQTGRGLPPPQPQGQPAPQSQGPAPEQAQPAPQAAQEPLIPRGADGRLDMGKLFMDTTTVPTWRQQAQIWANHPYAPSGGVYLKMLGEMAKSHIQQQTQNGV